MIVNHQVLFEFYK